MPPDADRSPGLDASPLDVVEHLGALKPDHPTHPVGRHVAGVDESVQRPEMDAEQSACLRRAEPLDLVHGVQCAGRWP